MSDCIICGESINKSTRANIDCCFCDFSACRTCWQTWFLSESIIKCMSPNCGKEWTRKYLSDTMTKSFISKDLKNHRENILFDKERALFPATQLIIGKVKEIDTLQKEYWDLERSIRHIRIKQNEVALRQGELRREIGRGVPKERAEFVRACPDENCQGFLSSQWKCGICDKWTCPECHEIKGLEKDCEHTCDPNNVETAKLLAKDTKACPSCGFGIYKIDGCDQMWCVKCHIQFSWRTGVELKGYNHNPEYFRWMRETGQTINPNPHQGPAQMMCGVNLDDYTITRIITNVFPRDQNIIATFQRLYRFYRHVEFKLTYITREENADNELKKLRVKYLLGDITRDKWKKTLQQIDKKTKKAIAYNNVWKLTSTVLGSYMEQIITCSNENSNKNEYIKILQEAEKFKMYANASFYDASNVFSSTSCPGIDDNWRECYNFKRYIKEKNKKSN